MLEASKRLKIISREGPKSAPYLRLKKTRKPLFLQLETTKALKKLKIEKKINFFEFFFEVSGKSHSAEKCKRGDAFYLMLDALDALKMKYYVHMVKVGKCSLIALMHKKWTYALN